MRHRLKVLFATRLGGLPKPMIKIVGNPSCFVLVWMGGDTRAVIMQHCEQPSKFSCRIFHLVALEAALEVDLETLDGSALLMEFLEAVCDRLAC